MGSHWGPQFGFGTHWGPQFPDPASDPATIPPNGPNIAATILAEMESGFTLTYKWKTDIFKAANGKEKQRHAVWDYPQQKFEGGAILVNNQPRSLRSILTRFSTSGAAFLLGLPYEALTLQADHTGTTLHTTTALMDWVAIGQRVIVQDIEGNSVSAVIQSYGGIPGDSQIIIDIDPGTIGRAGGQVMPGIPIYFEPQQDFGRFGNPESVEAWNFTARAALFGFLNANTNARLDLEGVAISGALDDAYFQAIESGSAGNDIQVEINGDSLSGVNFIEDPIAKTITIEIVPGDSTAGELATVLAGSTLIRMYGTWIDSDVLTSFDEFTFINLSGATDAVYNEIGVGATLTTYLGKPVWDRFIQIDQQAPDSIHTLTKIDEIGGTIFNRGTAIIPDGGRHIGMSANLGPDFQWLKKFLHTVYGMQKSFWLSSWRQDLSWISSGVNTIVIEGPDDESGSFFTYWPNIRRDIQIWQADGTITRVRITNAVDNSDGTVTLTTGVSLSGSPVTMISWLELCRFDTDEFSITFSSHRFEIETSAREIQQ